MVSDCGVGINLFNKNPRLNRQKDGGRCEIKKQNPQQSWGLKKRCDYAT
jgi:hypothetical protein